MIGFPGNFCVLHVGLLEGNRQRHDVCPERPGVGPFLQEFERVDGILHKHDRVAGEDNGIRIHVIVSLIREFCFSMGVSR